MRNLNKVMLIGNTTKEPELRYTGKGTAVCSFTVATNKEWKDSVGQAKKEATFTRCVAWSKLAEIIGQYVRKGSKVYIEGRLSNRQWKDQSGTDHYMTEIIADELILLDNKSTNQQVVVEEPAPPEPEPTTPEPEAVEQTTLTNQQKEVNPKDIPF